MDRDRDFEKYDNYEYLIQKLQDKRDAYLKIIKKSWYILLIKRLRLDRFILIEEDILLVKIDDALERLKVERDRKMAVYTDYLVRSKLDKLYHSK